MMVLPLLVIEVVSAVWALESQLQSGCKGKQRDTDKFRKIY